MPEAAEVTAPAEAPPAWVDEVRADLRRQHVRQAVVEVAGCLVVLFVGIALLVLGVVVHDGARQAHDDTLTNRTVGGGNRAVSCRTLGVVDPAADLPECRPAPSPSPK